MPPGSLVRLTSYSPFRGLHGTIQAVDTIADDCEEPFCFYLIALEGTHLKEPIWFEYDEVEVITSPLVASQEDVEFSSVRQKASIQPDTRWSVALGLPAGLE